MQNGRYEIMQQCFQLDVVPLDTTKAVVNLDAGGNTKTVSVQGGWYLDPPSPSGMVKSTREISSLAILLMNIYGMNPSAYKFVTFPGESYYESPYPRSAG